jgi:hypothetical protein
VKRLGWLGVALGIVWGLARRTRRLDLTPQAPQTVDEAFATTLTMLRGEDDFMTFAESQFRIPGPRQSTEREAS